MMHDNDQKPYIYVADGTDGSAESKIHIEALSHEAALPFEFVMYRPVRTPDLIHLVGSENLQACQSAAQGAARLRIPLVWTPLYTGLNHAILEAVLRTSQYFHNVLDLSRRLGRLFGQWREEYSFDPDNFNLWHGSMLDTARNAHVIIFSSEAEYRLFRKFGICAKEQALRKLATPEGRQKIIPSPFTEKYGSRKYVLCVGKLDPRNNQITLAAALAHEAIRLVFVGEGTDTPYGMALLKLLSPDALVIEHMTEEMLESAILGAEAVIQADFEFHPGFAARKTLALGGRLISGDTPAKREYLGTGAIYIDPAKTESVLKAFRTVVSSPHHSSQKEACGVKTDNNPGLADTTATIYARLLEKPSQLLMDNDQPLYVDMTYSAICPAHHEGIRRVELEYARYLHAAMADKVVFMVWNNHQGIFVAVDFEEIAGDKLKKYADEKLDDDQKSMKKPEGGINFQRGGHIASIGLSWMRLPSLLQAIHGLRMRYGLKFTLFVHDILPIRHPYFSDEGFASRCEKAFEQVFMITDRIIVNSKYTKGDITDWITARNLPLPPIEVARLGDISEVKSAIAPMDKILRVIGEDEFILYVSGNDKRKNHGLLHNVWRRLIAKYGPEQVPHLLLIGPKRGGSDAFTMMMRDPFVSSRIHLFNELEQPVLEWLYRNCLFTVFPSILEGWGLPVAESLCRGKICIASNATAVPEIAPELVDLIDPLDFTSWYERIDMYIFDRKKLKEREKDITHYKAWTWTEAGKQFAGLMNRNLVAPLPPILAINQWINFDSSPQSWQYLAGGWKILEDGRVFSFGVLNGIRFRLPAQGRKVSLELFREGIGDGVDNREIVVNGVRMAWDRGHNPYVSIAMPMTAAPGEIMDISIEIRKERRCLSDSSASDFLLRSAVLREMTEQEKEIEVTLERLDALIPGSLAVYRTFIPYREDIRALILKSGVDGWQSLLLWSWQYGLKEQQELETLKNGLVSALANLNGYPYSPHGLPEYSKLLHAIHQSRSDLSDFDCNSVEGQTAFLQWFDNNGKREYNLEEIFSPLVE